MNTSYTQAEELTVVNEHSVQIRLINLLSKAVSDGADNDEKLSILKQLIQFSQVHFMSEQLIMRQHGYHGYDEHDNEHVALVDYLHELERALTGQDSGLEQEQLNELRERMLNHIGSQDQKLSMFLSGHQDDAQSVHN